MKIISLFISLVLSSGAFASSKFDKGMQKSLEPYLKIHEALVRGEFKKVKPEAVKLEAVSKGLDASEVKGHHAGHYKNVPSDIRKYPAALKATPNIDAARNVFKDLSKPFAMWAGMAKPANVKVAYCPMVKASWLQASSKKKIENPYKPVQMPHCGNFI